MQRRHLKQVRDPQGQVLPVDVVAREPETARFRARRAPVRAHREPQRPASFRVKVPLACIRHPGECGPMQATRNRPRTAARHSSLRGQGSSRPLFRVLRDKRHGIPYLLAPYISEFRIVYQVQGSSARAVPSSESADTGALTDPCADAVPTGVRAQGSSRARRGTDLAMSGSRGFLKRRSAFFSITSRALSSASSRDDAATKLSSSTARDTCARCTFRSLRNSTMKICSGACQGPC